jgi:two-component system sensor histidine kinase KdpD
MNAGPASALSPENDTASMERISVRSLGEYSWAVCSVYVLASGCYLALPWTGHVFAALLFLFAVVLAGLRWQRGPVLLMGTLSALVWNFLFIPPKFSLHIDKLEDAIMLGLFFVVALSMGHLTSRLHAREQSLRRQQRETQALLEVLQKSVLALDFSGGFDGTVEAMKNVIGADLAVFLQSDAGEAEPVPHAASRFRASPEEWEAVRWCALSGKPAGRHMSKFPELETSWLPVESPKGRMGVVGFCWEQEKTPDFSTRRMMEALTYQLALLLERQQLLDDQRRAEMIAQSERLHRTLFDSVSHELKTPIAIIRAAVEGLPAKDPFAREIQTAAQRLQRIVESFLEMSRLESEHLSPRPDWTDFCDVLEGAKRILGVEWPAHLAIEPRALNLPLIRIDGRLSAQAVANIVHNAAQHTPVDTRIQIAADWNAGELIIKIRDHGPGIPRGSESQIFEKFYRSPGARPGGTGLGLAIARGFIRAQGGEILARNHPEGGAEFEIQLPTPTHASGEEQAYE